MKQGNACVNSNMHIQRILPNFIFIGKQGNAWVNTIFIPYLEDYAQFDIYRKLMKQGNAWVNTIFIPYLEDYAQFDIYRKLMKQGNAWALG